VASKTAAELEQNDATLLARKRPYAVAAADQTGPQPGSKGMGKGRGRIRGKGKRLVKKG
jgi:hypothetical protein